MCDLKVGEDAVCVKTHSQGVVKEGETYPVLAIKQKRNGCKCSHIIVDVGIKDDDVAPVYNKCGTCNEPLPHPVANDGIWWINAALFRPLDELTDITALTEILEQPVESLFKAK